jgi:2-polyprenyl-3-methyl-5-hydroxy-6-metoxy-1,4-benzoquinol methylase
MFLIPMAVYTTEIASAHLASDNPIHQRLLKAYYLALPYIKGHVLEVGCGEGRGVHLLAPQAESFTAIDKIGAVIDSLSKEFPQHTFRQANIPPFHGMEDNAFDVVVSFQVIEHIRDDAHYLREIYRVLKPGGVALITTPNIKKTLTRNPWHEREYTAEQLTALALGVFEEVDMKGVAGSKKVMDYWQKNKESVRKITRWDIFNLQYRLPAWMLRVPYDLLNRLNRNRLKSAHDDLVMQIGQDDYFLSDQPEESLDLFCLGRKSQTPS